MSVAATHVAEEAVFSLTSSLAAATRPNFAYTTRRHHLNRPVYSQAGQLLRHSKVFSLPPPLPPAPVESLNASPTATAIYPTRAAIETPQSSLARGDWGLKRPLPLKSTTNTSTPVIRVRGVDTIDHITDFESASDHVLTLRKWQEMNIPISMARRANNAGDYSVRNPVSVFEKHVDPKTVNVEDRSEIAKVTDAGENPTALIGPGNKPIRRWKFDGPWLAGLEQGEFEKYLKRIKPRKQEFEQFCATRIYERKLRESQTYALNEGKDFDPSSVKKFEGQDLADEMIALRTRVRELNTLIWEFLDLAGENLTIGPTGSREGTLHTATLIDKGSPTTHPSAGLSYLRTASHVENHPLVGPMQASRPVISRLIRREGQNGRQGESLVGVGGVLASVGTKVPSHLSAIQRIEDQGGVKIAVHPKIASINAKGRIMLDVDKADDKTDDIWEGRELERERLDEVTQGRDRNMPDLMDTVRRAPQVKGFARETVSAFLGQDER